MIFPKENGFKIYYVPSIGVRAGISSCFLDRVTSIDTKIKYKEIQSKHFEAKIGKLAIPVSDFSFKIHDAILGAPVTI